MDDDGRGRVIALGEILDRQVDPVLRKRVRTVVDRQLRREQPRPPVPAARSLQPGEVGPERVLGPKELTSFIRRAVSGDQRRTVWNHLGNEASVRLDSLRVATADGLVMVGLTLETDQTDAQELTTVFAVGSPKQPAGLLAVAEERPRGPGDLAATFAEPVIATCWRGLLLVVTAVAAAAGRDAGGDPLTPVALTATADGLVVHTIADHRLGRR